MVAGGCAWLGGVHGCWWRGGMHGCKGGHVWQRGVHGEGGVAMGAMHGKGGGVCGIRRHTEI